MWTKQKETEEQLPKRDYKETLLTDMKSKIQSIWCNKHLLIKPFASKGRWGVHAFWVSVTPWQFINFYQKSLFLNTLGSFQYISSLFFLKMLP